MSNEIERPFKELQKNYLERKLAAERWKKQGSKVAAYFGSDIPVEIPMAAGILPLRITGDPSSDTELADRYMEYYFDVQVRSMYNEVLKGNYSLADMIFVPHSSDSVLRLYYWLWEEKRLNEAMPFVRPYLFDRPRTQTRSAGMYMRDRVQALKERIEQHTGLPISKAEISKTIELTNRTRILLKQLSALRLQSPSKISGVEAMQVVGAAFFMAREDYNRFLSDYINENKKATVNEVKVPRFFVSGSTLDNIKLYELIESCHARVVAEDVDTGPRFFDGQIDNSLDPLEAISNYYWLMPSPHRVPMSVYTKYVLAKITEAKPDGVIFNYLQWDDSPAWHYPDLKKGLEDLGIPHFTFEFQDYALSAPERLKTRIEAFIETIVDGNGE